MSDQRPAENQVYRDPSGAVLRSQERILECISAGSSLSEALTDLIRLVEQTSDGALGSVLLISQSSCRVQQPLPRLGDRGRHGVLRYCHAPR